MPFNQVDALRYLTFEPFTEIGVVHGIFTRRGGSSPRPWSSLNTGATVGDDPFRVAENRRRLFHSIGRPVESMYDVWQVHGKDVICTSAPRPKKNAHIKADAILTDKPEVTLFMRFADCVPILLCDPARSVVGLAHAGWQGTVKKIASATIKVMKENYGCKPENIIAGIGPSIGPLHYQVGNDVVSAVQRAFGSDSTELLLFHDIEGDNGTYLDLWKANRLTLENAGVKHIELSELCTACNLDDWYSHRAEKGQTGRFGVLIGL
jgi:YfiH family protein